MGCVLMNCYISVKMWLRFGEIYFTYCKNEKPSFENDLAVDKLLILYEKPTLALEKKIVNSLL